MLPTLKQVIDAIESNVDDDGEPLYQNHKVYYYTREKHYLEDHAMHIVNRVVAYFEERYENLFNSVNVNSDTGNRVLFDVCRVLNCNVWQAGDSDFEEEDAYSIQINSLSTIFDRYKDMYILKPFTEHEVKNNFLAIVRYGFTYFSSTVDMTRKLLSRKLSIVL